MHPAARSQENPAAIGGRQEEWVCPQPRHTAHKRGIPVPLRQERAQVRRAGAALRSDHPRHPLIWLWSGPGHRAGWSPWSVRHVKTAVRTSGTASPPSESFRGDGGPSGLTPTGDARQWGSVLHPPKRQASRRGLVTASALPNSRGPRHRRFLDCSARCGPPGEPSGEVGVPEGVGRDVLLELVDRAGLTEDRVVAGLHGGGQTDRLEERTAVELVVGHELGEAGLLEHV